MTLAINSDLRGEVGVGAIEVTDAGVTLPDNVCRFVQLANWHVTAAQPLNAANAIEVLYGFNGEYCDWLRAGSRTSLLPISNTRAICLRTKPNQRVTIFFSYFN